MDTSIVPERTLAGSIEDLEALWSGFDTVWDALDASEWTRPYGKDWTFADQPFHMACYDRVMVNDPIEAGPELPASERWTADTMRELNDWNAREFARSVRGMLSGRIEVKGALRMPMMRRVFPEPGPDEPFASIG